jgi:quinol monooxygenase YgiN
MDLHLASLDADNKMENKELHTQKIILNIKVDVPVRNQKEFLQAALSIIRESRENYDCTSIKLNREIENENVFNIFSEWPMQRCIEEYIKSKNFGAMLGAINILAKDSELKIQNLSKADGIELIQSIRNRAQVNQ